MQKTIVPLLIASVLGGVVAVLVMSFFLRQSEAPPVATDPVAVESAQPLLQETFATSGNTPTKRSVDEDVGNLAADHSATIPPLNDSSRPIPTSNDAETLPSVIPETPLKSPNAENVQLANTIQGDAVPKEVMQPGHADSITSNSPTNENSAQTSPVSENHQSSIDSQQKQPTERVSVRLPRKVPPIPATKSKLSDSDFTRLRKEIRLELSARDAANLYEAFSKSYEFIERQQEIVDQENLEWKEKAKLNLLRLGLNWVPEQEFLDAEAEARTLIRRAEEFIVMGGLSDAAELLNQASLVNPNGIRADYELGLLNSLPVAGINGTVEAENRFKRVLLRNDEHSAALNSLAIMLIKHGNLGVALNNFRLAASESANRKEVIQNVGRLLHLAQQNRIPSDKRMVQRYRELYDELIKLQVVEHNPTQGWLHAIPVFPESERYLEEDHISEAEIPYQTIQTGNAIAIAKDYFLTDARVVYNDSYGVADQVKFSNQNITGNVVAISDTGLALIHARAVNANWLNVANVPSVQGAKLNVVNYLHNGIAEPMSAIVQSIPSDEPAERMYVELNSSESISGGALVNDTGELCGVLSQHSPSDGHIFPAADVQEMIVFLEEHLGTITPRSETSHTLPDRCVFQIESTYRSGILALTKVNTQNMPIPIYEDVTCTRCDGRGLEECRTRGCVNGVITTKSFKFGSVGIGENQVQTKIPVYSKDDCLTCVNGYVDCIQCVSGLDDMILKDRFSSQKIFNPFLRDPATARD